MGKKIVSLMLTLFMLLGVCTSTFAAESQTTVLKIQPTNAMGHLIEVVEANLVISKNKFVITDKKPIMAYIDNNLLALNRELGFETPKMSSVEIYKKINSLLQAANKSIVSRDRKVLSNGQLVEKNSSTAIRAYSSGELIESFWWGVRHTYYSDESARDYAYYVRKLSTTSAGIGGILGGLFGGVPGLPNGLTAIWGFSLADTIDYNASLPGNGIILEMTFLLTYKCMPR